MVLILIAFVLAVPVAYYVMHNWLQGFACQIGYWCQYFVIAILSSFAIAACTIAYEVIKAGVAKPVNGLQSE